MRKFSAAEANAMTGEQITRLKEQELTKVFDSILNACNKGIYTTKVNGLLYEETISCLRSLGYQIETKVQDNCITTYPETTSTYYDISWKDKG